MYIRQTCLLLCIKLQADHQTLIHLLHNGFIQMTDLILQSEFIDRTQLFQQDHGILYHVIPLRGKFNVRRQLRLIHL